MLNKLFVCLALVYLSSAYTIPFEGESSDIMQHDRVKRQNNVKVDVENQRQNGRDLGTKLTVNGGTRVWESEDGRGTLDAKAVYQRQSGGRNSGQDNYGGKLSFSWDFGKD